MRQAPASSAASPAAAPSRAGDPVLVEVVLRAVAVGVYLVGVVAFATAWLRDPSRWTLLLLLLTEGYTLVLLVIARRAQQRDLSPMSVAALCFAVLHFPLLDADGTVRLIPEPVGAAFQVAGMALQLWAKVTLGRSFGLLPATRGVVTAGPYRLVRHPIYLSYLVGHIGFLLANASWRNAAVLGLLYVAQVVRIAREERLLAGADAYATYRHQVRWRLVPFVY